MKHTQIFIFLFLVNWSLFAQNISKDVGNFHTVKVFDLIAVTLEKADENRIEINGPQSESVKIINADGILKIRMKLKDRFDGKQTRIKLFYTALNVVDANEGTTITFNQEVTQNELELKAQEGGFISASVALTRLKAKAVTGGHIQLTGTTQVQEVKLNTGGIFNGEHHITNSTDLTITAGGIARVHAKENIDLQITAGGDVYIFGNPKQIDRSQFIGGRVKVEN